MNRKNKVSTLSLVLLFLFVFVIGNISFAVICMLISDDTESNIKLIKEFVISSGTVVGINSVGLILIECFERLEKHIFKRKNSEECFGEGTFQVLRCSSRYYMLPIVSVMLDIMLVLLFRQGSREEVHEFLQSRDSIFPLCFILFYNLYSVYVIAHYCCYKVYYTGYLIEVDHFLRKSSFPWGEVKSIEYFYKDRYSRQRIVVRTETKKFVFRAEVLNDGWEIFVDWVQNMAVRYHILFNNKVLNPS